jgi:hypothetical protein
MEPESLFKETEPALHCRRLSIWAGRALMAAPTFGIQNPKYPWRALESLGDFTHMGWLDVTEPFGLADLDRGELARPDDRRDRQPPIHRPVAPEICGPRF